MCKLGWCNHQGEGCYDAISKHQAAGTSRCDEVEVHLHAAGRPVA